MNITLDEGALMPERAHNNDAGLDLKSREDAVVPAGGSYVFDTGVHIELPRFHFYAVRPLPDETSLADDSVYGKQEYEICKYVFPTAGFLKSKSGLNVNHDIASDGVVDIEFTGSIRVKLYNHGTEDYHVRRGDKISQLVIVPVLTPSVEVVDALDETERGSNGFGSTGR